MKKEEAVEILNELEYSCEDDRSVEGRIPNNGQGDAGVMRIKQALQILGFEAISLFDNLFDRRPELIAVDMGGGWFAHTSLVLYSRTNENLRTLLEAGVDIPASKELLEEIAAGSQKTWLSRYADEALVAQDERDAARKGRG